MVSFHPCTWQCSLAGFRYSVVVIGREGCNAFGRSTVVAVLWKRVFVFRRRWKSKKATCSRKFRKVKNVASVMVAGWLGTRVSLPLPPPPHVWPPCELHSACHLEGVVGSVGDAYVQSGTGMHCMFPPCVPPPPGGNGQRESDIRRATTVERA